PAETAPEGAPPRRLDEGDGRLPHHDGHDGAFHGIVIIPVPVEGVADGSRVDEMLSRILHDLSIVPPGKGINVREPFLGGTGNDPAEPGKRLLPFPFDEVVD